MLWMLSTITNFMTDTHSHGHSDSMTDPAQRTKSVKIVSESRNMSFEFSPSPIVQSDVWCVLQCTVQCVVLFALQCVLQCVLQCAVQCVVLCAVLCLVQFAVQCAVLCVVQCEVQCAVLCVVLCAVLCVVQCAVQCAVLCVVQFAVQYAVLCVIQCEVQYAVVCVVQCAVPLSKQMLPLMPEPSLVYRLFPSIPTASLSPPFLTFGHHKVDRFTFVYCLTLFIS